MPLEIRELVIRATVASDTDQNPGANGNADAAKAKEADVNLIVEKVLEILKEKAER